MRKLIYNHFGKLFFLFTVLSSTSVTIYWWLSIFSLIFYVWNYFNEKRYLRANVVFFFLTILLIVFNFAVIKPTKEWGDKVQAEWDITGYDSTFLASAQESINVLERSVEEYKNKYGGYPNQLNEIQDMNMSFANYDMSYRIKDSDGKTRGGVFYYKKINSKMYSLAGVGRDGIINTSDDLLPQISISQKKITGLQNYVVKSFTIEEIQREIGLIKMHRRLRIVEKLNNYK